MIKNSHSIGLFIFFALELWVVGSLMTWLPLRSNGPTINNFFYRGVVLDWLVWVSLLGIIGTLLITHSAIRDKSFKKAKIFSWVGVLIGFGLLVVKNKEAITVFSPILSDGPTALSIYHYFHVFQTLHIIIGVIWLLSISFYLLFVGGMKNDRGLKKCLIFWGGTLVLYGEVLTLS